MKTKLFNEHLNSEHDWLKVFQSVEAFSPLIEHIFKKEDLPFAILNKLTPGTNAVFKTGNYVIKIFAPVESKVEQRLPQVEIFATCRANELGVSTPKVITHGSINDKYHFTYLITEYIENKLDEIYITMTDSDKMDFGKKLRTITDIMNVPCKLCNEIEVINGTNNNIWYKYPKLQDERLNYIETYNFGENVLVHSDLCGDNFLLSKKDEIYIIDFADAVIAPKIYEHALLAIESELDPMILRGYFDDYMYDDFINMCFNGILLSNDEEIIFDLIGEPGDSNTLDDLRNAIIQKNSVFQYHK